MPDRSPTTDPAGDHHPAAAPAATPAATLLPAGVGLGWRPPIAGHFPHLPNLAFSEVIAGLVAHPHDGAVHCEVPPLLQSTCADPQHPGRTIPVVPHSVTVNLGSADDFDPAHAEALAAAANALDAPLASEHISFTRAGGIDVGHLTPLPRTREAVAVLARNTEVLTGMLEVPLALENIAPTLGWPEDELTEAEFVDAVCEATGAHLLLDIHNVYTSAVNADRDPAGELLAMPLERIAYCHIAGGRRNAQGRYVDTHSEPVPRPVLDLLGLLTSEIGPLPVLLERDANYPGFDELAAELDAIAAANGGPA